LGKFIAATVYRNYQSDCFLGPQQLLWTDRM